VPCSIICAIIPQFGNNRYIFSMKNSLIFFIFVLVTLFFQVFGQNVPPRTPLTFNVDVSQFRYSQDMGSLEVFFVAYPSGVTLEKKLDTLWGTVVFRVLVKDVYSDSLVIQSFFSVQLCLADTALSSFNTGFVGKTKYILPFGLYKLTVQGYDGREPARQDSVHRQFSIGRYDSIAMISDLILCSRIEQTLDKSNPFYKNSYEVISNPSLVFGKSSKPVVFVYAELYNLEIGKPYFLEARIVDVQNKILKQQRKRDCFRFRMS
jgi:hypothetical protein